MVSSMVLSKKISTAPNFSDKIVAAIKKRYTPALKMILRRQKVVLVVIGALFVVSIVLFKQLGAEFIPSLDEGDFAVETRLMTGSGLNKTIDATTKASRILLKKFPEIKQVIGKIGTAEIPTDPMPMEACDLMLILKDKEDWVSAHDKETLAAKMQAVLDKELPGVSFGFQQPIQMRFNELMTGAKQDVVVKIYGEDFDKLAAYAKKVGSIARSISGVQDVYVEELSGLPQLIVRYDREALARYQVSIEEINRAVNLGFAGQIAGYVFEGERRYQLVVKLREADRSSFNDIEQLYVTNAAGTEIPLAELADIRLENGPNQIQREDAKRRIIVGFNVRGRDVESIIEQLQDLMRREIIFDTGYFPQIGGTFENLVHARQRLLIAVPISLLLIFFLLYLTFQSMKQAALIYSAIPLASIGGIIALYLRGMPFSISAGVGFIALFGVAVLNGIVLIAEFNTLRKTGAPILQVVLRGTANRLRPVLLTATVASLGFLPMALSHGSGAEVQKPLATVVIGGLLTATILTLFILPLLYLLFEKPFRLRSKKGLVLLAILSFSGGIFSQQTLTDEQFFELLLNQNGRIKAELLESQRQLQLAHGTSGWQPLGISYMQGQFNSAYARDNNLTLSQAVPYNGALRIQTQIGQLNGQLSEQNLILLKKDFKRLLNEQLEQIRYLQKQLALAKQQDSLYQILSQKVSLRVQNGEAPKLEQILLQSKTMRSRAQVQQLSQELSNAWLYLQQFLGVKEGSFELAQPEAISYLKAPLFDASNVHPSIVQYEIKKKQLLLEQDLNAVQQLPQINLSYFNQSLVGWQNIDGNDQYFGPKQRFQGAAIQTQIPIDWHAYRARASAIELQAQQLELRKSQQEFDLQNERKRLYNLLLERISSYQQLAAPIAVELDKLQSDAQLQMNSGEISLIDFIQLQDYQLTLQQELLQWQHELKLLHISYEWIQK
jgi:cobalt-zinc-cadmium resistance protein CzcA